MSINTNKKTLLLIASVITIAFLFLISWLLSNQSGEPAPPTPPENNQIPTPQTHQEEIREDRNQLKRIAPTSDPIRENNFELFYMDVNDTFVAIIYQGEREEVIQEIYRVLKGKGINNPEELNIVFSGPRDYESHVPGEGEVVN